MPKGQSPVQDAGDEEARTADRERSREAREHAFDFMLPADPAAAIRRVGERFIRAAETDEGVAAKFQTIRDRISGTELIRGPQMDLYERLAPSAGLRLEFPTAPAWLRPALVVAYLRAKSIIASGRFRDVASNPGRALDRALAAIDSLEPDFVGELTVEATLAAQRDPAFARRLAAAGDEFRGLVDALYGPPDPDDRDGEDTRGQRTMARMAGASGSGGACTCCTTVNGNRTCEPCSCWIIVVIIIIIIVAK